MAAGLVCGSARAQSLLLPSPSAYCSTRYGVSTTIAASGAAPGLPFPADYDGVRTDLCTYFLSGASGL